MDSQNEPFTPYGKISVVNNAPYSLGMQPGPCKIKERRHLGCFLKLQHLQIPSTHPLFSFLSPPHSVEEFYPPKETILPFLLCAKSLQLCLTLCDPMDCSPPGSSVHGILQAGLLESAAMPSSRGSS